MKIATFNVRGLSATTKQKCLAQDMLDFDIDVCCLQETKVAHQSDQTINGIRIILIPGAACQHYGLGFAINEKKMKERFKSFTSISDRIAELTFDLDKDKQLVLINVYAPTQARVNSNEQERETFYEQLEAQVRMHDTRRTHLVIAGDFNSKVGKRANLDRCMGAYTRGRRNDNRHRLAEFCHEHELLLANSLFRHRACHMTTWVGSRHDKETQKTVPIYNQIDYVIVKQHQRAYITDARAYSGTTTNSDHRIVIMTWSLKFKRATRQQAKTVTKYDTNKLANDTAVQIEYQADYDERRKHTPPEQQPNPQLKLVAIQDTVIKPTQRKYDCPIIAALSAEQKDLRAQIQNSTCPKLN